MTTGWAALSTAGGLVAGRQKRRSWGRSGERGAGGAAHCMNANLGHLALGRGCGAHCAKPARTHARAQAQPNPADLAAAGALAAGCVVTSYCLW